MIDAALIRKHMVQKRYTVRQLSRDSDISEASLGNKLSGKTQFKADEIAVLAKLLELSDRDLIACFFAKKVD